ncbi:MAG TPA: outer membrane lipoprotein-sorting protein [Prolixibacteraceae bacterium]|nr:outer membrane lipoprotein-sorting protein [Prolixibacteraceae bacterium]HPS12685.1 outer membrane lipoprotein-sorting protein [Prolixibacteraceae bacterium]
MKTLIFTIGILFACITLKAQDAREISEKASNAIQLDAMEMVSTLKISSAKGDERSRTMSTATRKFDNVSKTMMKFIEPADVRGTTLLVFDYEDKDDDMWIYMPALRKTRRIVSSEKGKNFMGSEFTNADMSKPNLDEFNYKLLGDETIDGNLCWKVESTCKTEDQQDQYGFSKRVIYVDKANYLTYKMEYYDLSGELSKVESMKEYKKQSNGSYFAFLMEMKNVKNNRRSVMTIDKFQLGSKISEAQFSPAMIEK